MHDLYLSGHAQSQIPAWGLGVLLLGGLLLVLGAIGGRRGSERRPSAKPASPPADVPAARVVKRP
jgi:hypothetical protein